MCSGWCAFCLSCGACSARFCVMGSMLVSSCKCCVIVSRVHPVVIRSTLFCTVCSLLVFVSDIIGDKIVLPYSSVVRVMAVYVLSNVSFEFSQVRRGERF